MEKAPDGPPRPLDRLRNAPNSAEDAAPPDEVPTARKPRIEVLRGDSAPPRETIIGRGSVTAEPRRAGSVGLGLADDHNDTMAPIGGDARSERRSRTWKILGALGALAILPWACVYLGVSEKAPDRRPSEYAESSDNSEEPARSTEVLSQTPLVEAAQESSDPGPAAPETEIPVEPSVVAADPTAEPVRADPVVQPRRPDPPAQPARRASAAGGGSSAELRTVQGFYSALGRGDGDLAAQSLVPAKRSNGPLSARALTRYFSSFERPLRLRSAKAVDADTVDVTYDYVLPGGRRCDGRASVDLVSEGGEPLIRAIRTQGPC